MLLIGVANVASQDLGYIDNENWAPYYHLKKGPVTIIPSQNRSFMGLYIGVPKPFMFDPEKGWAKYHNSPEMICATGMRNCVYAT